MAVKKRQFTTSEATSLGAWGGGWQVATRIDISSATQKHHSIDLQATKILLQPDSDILVSIDSTSDTANNADNDLVLTGNGLIIHEIAVPKGIQEGNPATQLYLHIKQVTSVASKYCRVVEV